MNFPIHAMAATLLAALWKDGGGTIDPRTGELAKFRSGFLVSRQRYEKKFLHWPNVNEIAAWLSEVADGWRRGPNQLFPGIVYEPDLLSVFCDLNELVNDEVLAVKIGRQERQHSIRNNSISKNILVQPTRRAA
jgi:hypothetical protein